VLLYLAPEVAALQINMACFAVKKDPKDTSYTPTIIQNS
jgi:hypothetical protein